MKIENNIDEEYDINNRIYNKKTNRFILAVVILRRSKQAELSHNNLGWHNGKPVDGKIVWHNYDGVECKEQYHWVPGFLRNKEVYARESNRVKNGFKVKMNAIVESFASGSKYSNCLLKEIVLLGYTISYPKIPSHICGI